MKNSTSSRREFLRTGKDLALGVMAGSLGLGSIGCRPGRVKSVVGIAKIRNDRIDMAVESAIELIGGIGAVTRGKERIMLKPNLTNAIADDTTHPEIVKTLASLMTQAGKNVLIGEGSAGAKGFNVIDREICRTNRRDILDPMQQFVFDELGYSDISRTLSVPLINLHSGEITEVDVPDAFVVDKLSLHRSLTEVDLLCSVPKMKTHQLATVTLGMKNLLGLLPGTIYHSIRRDVHERTSVIDPSGTAAVTVDLVKAIPPGLIVIDGSTAMEGQGPSISTGGTLVKMGLIIAGTNVLATDMVAAHVMGFEKEEIPTFDWAHRAGLTPMTIEDIEIRTDGPVVRQALAKPKVTTWASLRESYGERVI
jgi:uncharacterized protein (DUF362 family)